jgi:hypothetical protein
MLSNSVCISAGLKRGLASPGQVLLRETVNQIPVVHLTELLGDRKCQIKLRVMKREDGMIPYNDALALLSILLAESPNQVLKIGTYMGHTAHAMAENLENATIHTIDLPSDFSASEEVDNRIVQHFANTVVMDFAQIGRPSFFFIDGTHTYEHCKSDSEKCLILCPHGGTFSGMSVMRYIWVSLNSYWNGAGRGRNVVHIDGTSLAYWKS